MWILGVVGEQIFNQLDGSSSLWVAQAPFCFPPSSWCVQQLVLSCCAGLGSEQQKEERAVSRKWRTRRSGPVRGSLLDAGSVRLSQTFTSSSSSGGRRRHRGPGLADPAAAAAPAPAASGRNNLTSGIAEEFHSRNRLPPSSPFPFSFSFFSPRLLRGFSSSLRDPRWGRSRSFSRRRARATLPPWRSFYPGSGSQRAPAAGRRASAEVATAAATEPPLTSPVCSGRQRRVYLTGSQCLPSPTLPDHSQLITSSISVLVTGMFFCICQTNKSDQCSTGAGACFFVSSQAAESLPAFKCAPTPQKAIVQFN